jgi:hypothetical protein
MDFVILITGPFFLVYRFGQTIPSSIGASNLWPLVAVSHQMTVRDAAPLQFEKSDGLISRIQGS